MSETTTGPDAAAIAADAETKAQARMKAILTSDAGKALPTLASHLAYDTKMTSEDALKVLASAQTDAPKVAPAVEPVDPAAAAAAFEASKTAAGALGLGHPAPAGVEKPDAQAGWSKAIANVNKNMGIAS